MWGDCINFVLKHFSQCFLRIINFGQAILNWHLDKNLADDTYP